MHTLFIQALKYIFTALVSLNILISSAFADKMKVAFINPSYPEEPFWSLMTNLMQSVAHDLDIDLQVYYSDRNRFQSLALAQEILSADQKPDYLVFHFQAQIGASMLLAAEQAKVYSLVINTNAPEADKADIGEPRDKFKYWLGHIIPDDFQAGSLLTSALIEKAATNLESSANKTIQMFGLTGSYDNTASIERELALRSLVKHRKDVILHQIVSASWDKQKASQITKVLMTRYPETKLIWSASDLMALGAIEALEDMGLKPGVDVLVGGVDGLTAAMEAISNGKMAATVSGHFIEAAWALLLLFEHYHGKDLLEENGPTLNSRMYLIDAANVATVRSRMNATYFDALDFKSFTTVKSFNTKNESSSRDVPLMFPKSVLSGLIENAERFQTVEPDS